MSSLTSKKKYFHLAVYSHICLQYPWCSFWFDYWVADSLVENWEVILGGEGEARVGIERVANTVDFAHRKVVIWEVIHSFAYWWIRFNYEIGQTLNLHHFIFQSPFANKNNSNLKIRTTSDHLRIFHLFTTLGSFFCRHLHLKSHKL